MLFPLQRKCFKALNVKVTKVEKREKDGINAVKLKYFKNEQSAAKPAKEGSETNSMSVGTLVPKWRPPYTWMKI